jgi:hypothetical protein
MTKKDSRAVSECILAIRRWKIADTVGPSQETSNLREKSERKLHGLRSCG